MLSGSFTNLELFSLIHNVLYFRVSCFLLGGGFSHFDLWRHVQYICSHEFHVVGTIKGILYLLKVRVGNHRFALFLSV